MELSRIVEALSRPGAYPHPAGEIVLHHTHISVVFLAGPFAYKVKKPVDLGFLDFTTLERRRHFCHEEVRLNRRLAPDVYRGVVPILEESGELRVGRETLPPPSSSGSGAAAGDGTEAVEYAVKMERLPPEATLERRLEDGRLEPAELRTLARRIAEFHREADAGPEIAGVGGYETVARNVRENFEQTASHLGVTIREPVRARLARRTEEELQRSGPLIRRRADEGVPRDTHGDLHLAHVYLFPEREPPRDLMVVDCIEFNRRFRYADPVADTAFLCMDLAYHGRRDLEAVFADAYFEAAEDPEGRRLLPFYAAYRAAVRGKVEGITALDDAVPDPEREGARRRARGHWLLALDYLESPERRPGLVLVAGLPGTGKSTLARGLSERHGFRVVSSDRTRKELAGLPPETSADAGFGEGLYGREWTDRTYRACRERARDLLLDGERVLVDATFREEERRRRFLEAADELAVRSLVLLCEAGPEVVRRRLAGREGGASDADWEVYREAAARWEDPEAAVRRRTRTVDTAGTAEEAAAMAGEHLREAGLAP